MCDVLIGWSCWSDWQSVAGPLSLKPTWSWNHGVYDTWFSDCGVSEWLGCKHSIPNGCTCKRLASLFWKIIPQTVFCLVTKAFCAETTAARRRNNLRHLPLTRSWAVTTRNWDVLIHVANPQACINTLISVWHNWNDGFHWRRLKHWLRGSSVVRLLISILWRRHKLAFEDTHTARVHSFCKKIHLSILSTHK